MPISSQYVFELQFHGDNYGEKQFVIMDDESMADFSKLKEDLSKCTPDPFRVQYIDDEEDMISIDTEEEFTEFAKLAKQRSSRGMLIKLILNSYDLPLDLDKRQHIPSQTATEIKVTNGPKRQEKQLEIGAEAASGSNDMTTGADDSEYTFITKKELCEMMVDFVQDVRTLNSHSPQLFTGAMKKAAVSDLHTTKPEEKEAMIEQAGFYKFKSRIKAELKEEILSEMKSKMRTSNEATSTKSLQTHTEYEEDSDGNLVLEKRKAKYLQNQKKLEKKEKISEIKIDQRLEKLELKKKKLLEKSLRINRKPVLDPIVGLPCILSAVATADSSTLPKKVAIGKVFIHVWQVVNDGTVAWNNVELRHTWSSPGLEPDELSVKCLPLIPGAESMVMMKFKAPKTVGPFISYWHFFYQIDSQWQQFGHYVSVTGNTKMSNTDTNKKLKHDIKTVTLIEKERDTPKEIKVMNKETSEVMTLKERLVARLASSEIAAEMAREAANAAFRRAVGNQAAANIKSDVSKQAEKDHTVPLAERLNVEESGSDTDANLDVNEETDPGFVIVDIPSCFSTDKSKVKNIKVSLYPSGDLREEIIKTNINDENNGTFMKEDNKNEVSPNETVGLIDPSRDDKKEDVNGANLLGSPIPDNHVPVPEELEEQDEPQPQVLPRLDPNVNYPMFTPPRPHIFSVPQHHPAHTPPFGGAIPLYNGPSIIAPAHSQMPHFAPPTLPKMQVPPAMYPYPMNAPPPANIPISGFPPAMPPSSQGYTLIHPPVSSGNFQMGPPMLQGLKFLPYVSSSTDSNVKTMYTPSFLENIPPTTTIKVSENRSEIAQPQAGMQLEQEKQPESQQAAQQETETQPKAKAQPQSNKTDKGEDSGVQILPQGLVDGAINVAASAYSTAWNALNNLRPKEGIAVEFDPVFENNMALLVEMGFTNLERNAMLLKRFNNDVSQVIGVICATGGGEGLNID